MIVLFSLGLWLQRFSKPDSGFGKSGLNNFFVLQYIQNAINLILIFIPCKVIEKVEARKIHDNI